MATNRAANQKRWIKNHIEQYRQYQREYRKRRRFQDPEFLERTKNNAAKSRTRPGQSKRQLKYTHGDNITDKLFEIIDQIKLCEICNSEFQTSLNKHVDHDHTTGKIRGVLCGHCNRGLGNFRDSIEFLESAIQYMKDKS